jgi:hypothetical protein
MGDIRPIALLLTVGGGVGVKFVVACRLAMVVRLRAHGGSDDEVGKN